MKRDTDADSADNRIDDVDQIFESFVKKKLQQLGMKRAAAKAVNIGPMRELAGDVKMKLEQSLSNGDGVSQSRDSQLTEESEYQPPVPVKVKKKDKKEKKSKKKKKEKKKKKDKETEKKTKKASGKQDEKEKKKIKKDRSEGKSKIISQAESQSTTSLKTDEVGYENAGKTSVPNVDQDATAQKDVPVVTSRTITREALTPKDTVSNLPQPKAKTEKGNSSPAAQPKKDIATIKMKVELLRAKSVKEEIRNKTGSLLQVQTPKDEKVVEHVESQQASSTRELKKRNSSSRSRSRSRSRKRSRRHSRHRSRSRSRSGSRTRRIRRHRSRSPHRRNHHRKRKSRSSERRTYKSKKSRRSHSPHISAEDKVRLLEIAKANALAQHKASSAGVSMSSVGQLIKAGSMSVTELTNMCKDIADGKEAKVAEVPKTKTEAEQMIEEAAARVHHPFAVRDKPIIFNIKHSLAPPPPSASRPVAVLSKEFPVSCGQQHRRKEVLESVYGKWEVVAKDEATKNAVKELVASDKVFVEPEPVELDIGSVMAERATAAKQLQEDPNSEEAQGMMLSIQQRLNRWTQSKQIIGQFTGESGIQPMPKAQLESGRPAWFKQKTRVVDDHEDQRFDPRPMGAMKDLTREFRNGNLVLRCSRTN